ncbi:MAG: tetratricopeptide repeat protein, partial [Muribaculaceae bacterium]|nr:tetratricopeptide repeat protein [Muribaculaceae bacterium]
IRDHLAVDSEDEVYYTAGRLCWQLGRQADAMGFYRRALAVNPDSPARYAMEMAKDVLDFYNPDLLNP